MPRIPRGANGEQVLHVLNRGNARSTLFHEAADYRAFIALLGEAVDRFDIRIYAFCVMPNHFHLVLHPGNAPELSAMLQWWLTSHVRRHHRVHGTSGHLWQGRSKSFPIQQDEHMLTVLRYVLLNPVRAQLVADAYAWPWSSLQFPELTRPWLVRPPRDLPSWLSDGIPAREMERIRESIARRCPYGDETWQRETARANGLVRTLRQRGRPWLHEET